MEIIKIIDILKAKRKFFCSESDFQFSLALEIQKYYSDANIFLEYCPNIQKNTHIDVVVGLDNNIYPVELKYKPTTFMEKINDEPYELRKQGGQNIGRYDYLKDIQRIEEFSKILSRYKLGYSILLTNDKSYWEKNKKGAMDEQFHLTQDVLKTGVLTWNGNTDRKNRNKPIELKGKYKIDWKEYSKFDKMPNGEFKYCLTESEKI